MATRLNAVHGLNAYLWKKGLNPTYYEPTNPQDPVFQNIYQGRNLFVPVNNIAKFNEMKDGAGQPMPYIVYNWSFIPPNGTNFFLKSEQVLYLIYGTDWGTLRKMSNFLVDELNQFDIAAQRVQTFLEKEENNSEYRKFEYQSISVESATGPLPMDEAGGRMEAQITVRLDYTYENIG